MWTRLAKTAQKFGLGAASATQSVVLFDPSIVTRNIGDEIIAEACTREIAEIFPEKFLCHAPTHESIGPRTYKLLHQSQLALLAGSNLLTGRMFGDRGWRIDPKDLVFVSDLVAMAIGWRSYQPALSWSSRLMLRRLLSRTWRHSVRDTYTAAIFGRLGFDNVLMTSCATMWRLTPQHLAGVPTHKAENVVFTLNSNKISERDRVLIDCLKRHYKRLFFFPQGIDDIAYGRSLADGSFVQIDPSLQAFDRLLASDLDLDYVGLRLHGGIRALQHQRRTLIISIDNRAREIARDTGLPAVEQDELDERLDSMLVEPRYTRLRIPFDAIETWKEQFKPVPIPAAAYGTLRDFAPSPPLPAEAM